MVPRPSARPFFGTSRRGPRLSALALIGVLGCGRGMDAGGAAPPNDLTCQADAGIHSGQATYYTFANGDGACMFGPSPNDLMIGAMNATDYAGSSACGACVRLQGPKAEITIRIVDLCPECPAGNIDLSPDAFGRIADLSAGRVPITWQYVSCAVFGPIRYHFKDGSSQWWTAVQIRNHANRIAKVEYLSGGTYRPIARTDYNYFVVDSGLGPGPYAFRATDVYGHVVEDDAVPLVVNGDSAGSGQFAVCAGP